MKMIEDTSLLAHKRRVEAERRTRAIQRRRYEQRVAPFALIANAPRRAA